ncbi:carbonic anhydrase family protein [Variovorax robiniae]|uniref:carbonic anhydrase n=1 Tax=Variovorax robiniae TaxID=1836199 RepID=A0ABU8XHE6_9BURK
MNSRFIHIALAATLAAPMAHAQPIDYENQEEWKAVHGNSQSPIDVVTSKATTGDAKEPQAIRMGKTRSKLEVEDNGHAVEVEVDGPDAVIRGRHFKMAQFHFHAASEHTINGEHAPLEGHFVFKAADGRLAVVGVMYRPGAANALAGRVLQAISKSKKGELPSSDISSLLPRNKAYYHYLGSLTTPPLAENVEWYVLKEPVSMSEAQLDEFRKHYPHNNRKIQELNNRPLVAYPMGRKGA